MFNERISGRSIQGFTLNRGVYVGGRGEVRLPSLVGSDGGWAEVTAPAVYVERCGMREGDAACDHGQEDQSDVGDERDCGGVGAGCR